MINQTLSLRTFILDSYIHAFMALAVMTIIFLFATIKRYRNDVNTMCSETLDEMNLSSHVSKTSKAADDAKLDNLSNIYENDSFFSKEIRTNLKISLYTQLVLLGLTVLVLSYVANKEGRFWKRFIFEKFVFFAIFLCLEYIFYETVVNEYQDIMKEDIYNILKDKINTI